MADAIRIPRRKKGAKFHPKEAPFPIPIRSITGKQSCNDRWYYYTGHFRDNCVVIEDLGDLTFLYKMGFFGKGFLSRSKPAYETISNISQKAFSKSEKLRRLPPKEREIRQSKFRVIRKERFKNHQQWWQQAMGTEEDEKNNVDGSEKCDNQICGKSVEDPIVDEEREYTSHPAKRRKEDIAHDDEVSCVNQPELQNDRYSVEITPHSSDEEEIRNMNNSEDDAEIAGITNRDLDEVMRDVVKNSDESSSTCCVDSNEDKSDVVTTETNQKGSSTRQDDPYKVYEHLQLSLEEAFFLSYGLGCLSVLNDSQKPMSLSEMWCAFCEAKQDFIPNYITYHYFRSKGWVPKMGIKYGTDLVLYKEGMPFYHSSYSVIVQLVEFQSLETEKHDKTIPCRQLSWPQLCGVSRVNEHAAKEVMICYVIKPSGSRAQKMDP
ncbi:tRNA-splicing endonuclease subunit Sen2-like isoform X2 [Oculina patagonica]